MLSPDGLLVAARKLGAGATAIPFGAVTVRRAESDATSVAGAMGEA